MTPRAPKQPIDVLQDIKIELERTGSESYFIGKKVEDLLARVYFQSTSIR